MNVDFFLSDLKINTICQKFTEQERYLTVDELNNSSKELAKAYPNIVEFSEIGESSSGETIYSLKIGKGRFNALLYGFPNSEEPVGSLMLECFSALLVEDEELRDKLDFTWHIVKCIDPDGARLNEGFFDEPYNIVKLALNYYRYPDARDGESMFPLRYKTLDVNDPCPETRALMTILDKDAFHLMATLHNIKWGGMNFCTSRLCPQLYPSFLELAKKLNIPLGWRPLVQRGLIGVPSWFSHIKEYELMASKGIDPTKYLHGGTTLDYARLRNPDVFMFSPEPPVFHDPRMWDNSRSEKTVYDMMDENIGIMEQDFNYLKEKYGELETILSSDSPFTEAVKYDIESGLRFSSEMRETIKHKKSELGGNATISELYGYVTGRAKIYSMFNWGKFYRLCKYELDNKKPNRKNKEKLQELSFEFKEKIEIRNKEIMQDKGYVAVPIKNLVKIDLISILIVANYLKWINSY
jgi:hypothetical protein